MTKKEKQKKYHAEYYQKNKERLTIQNRKWALENNERYKEIVNSSYHRRKKDPKNIKLYLLKHAKARANKKGIECSISEDDIILPLLCPIMKQPFVLGDKKYTYSLDRIDPTKGYTKDNIWVISLIANSMKWTSTPEERLIFAKWVLSLEGG